MNDIKPSKGRKYWQKACLLQRDTTNRVTYIAPQCFMNKPQVRIDTKE